MSVAELECTKPSRASTEPIPRRGLSATKAKFLSLVPPAPSCTMHDSLTMGDHYPGPPRIGATQFRAWRLKSFLHLRPKWGNPSIGNLSSSCPMTAAESCFFGVKPQSRTLLWGLESPFIPAHLPCSPLGVPNGNFHQRGSTDFYTHTSSPTAGIPLVMFYPAASVYWGLISDTLGI